MGQEVGKRGGSETKKISYRGVYVSAFRVQKRNGRDSPSANWVAMNLRGGKKSDAIIDLSAIFHPDIACWRIGLREMQLPALDVARR